ncbi:MAG: RNA methyltransferase [Ignavibacteria bacterium]|nr:MAG: RNA methyltransferase [Ignavibacteria bacterium]
MISNNELKYYSSLLNKKYRKIENKFLIEGKKNVEEGLDSNYDCEKVFITRKFEETNPELIKKIRISKVQFEVLKSVEFQRISDTKAPQGIAAVLKNKSSVFSSSLIKDKVLVYLEDISDPGNLGTIIRNCDWFGINNILLSKESAEMYNPKVLRASMGSIFHLNVFEDITLKKITQLKISGYAFICSDTEGKDVFDFKLNDKIILFLSNESKGPSQELLSITDHKITIPRKGNADSLNVASASAIILAALTK